MEPISAAGRVGQRQGCPGGDGHQSTKQKPCTGCVRPTKGPRLPGGGEKINKLMSGEKEFLTALLMTKHLICTVEVSFLLTLLQLEHFTASWDSFHGTG